jgi:hypothetical protein
VRAALRHGAAVATPCRERECSRRDVDRDGFKTAGVLGKNAISATAQIDLPGITSTRRINRMRSIWMRELTEMFPAIKPVIAGRESPREHLGEWMQGSGCRLRGAPEGGRWEVVRVPAKGPLTGPGPTRAIKKWPRTSSSGEPSRISVAHRRGVNAFTPAQHAGVGVRSWIGCGRSALGHHPASRPPPYGSSSWPTRSLLDGKPAGCLDRRELVSSTLSKRSAALVSRWPRHSANFGCRVGRGGRGSLIHAEMATDSSSSCARPLQSGQGLFGLLAFPSPSWASRPFFPWAFRWR